MTSQTASLPTLIRNSVALSDDNRVILLEIYQSLPNDMLAGIEVILMKEEKTIRKVEENYEKKTVEVQKNYIRAMKDFVVKTVNGAFKLWEKRIREKELREAELLVE